VEGASCRCHLAHSRLTTAGIIVIRVIRRHRGRLNDRHLVRLVREYIGHQLAPTDAPTLALHVPWLVASPALVNDM
jgi:hypothetical protein